MTAPKSHETRLVKVARYPLDPWFQPVCDTCTDSRGPLPIAAPSDIDEARGQAARHRAMGAYTAAVKG